MTVLETLRKDHNDVFKRIHLIETSQIYYLTGKARMPLDRYMNFVKKFSQFFKTGLVYHFKVEEEALFPVLKEKVEISIIQDLLSEHERIVKGFHEFEFAKNYDLSIQILKSLINTLSIHAKKEGKLFSSIILSDEELKRIDEMAELVR